MSANQGQQDWHTVQYGGAAAPNSYQQPQYQQPQQLGYGQTEHAHIMTAMRQPLFIQTPLQSMLESLVEKLQLQAGVISIMQDKLEALELGKVNTGELVSRMQVLEDRMQATAGSPLTPFAQADVLKRLQELEHQSKELEAASAQLAFRTDQVLLPRLQQCESRLAGCHNIAGSLMAVDLIAAELGIGVPHPPLAALNQVEQQMQQQQQPGSQAWLLPAAAAASGADAPLQQSSHSTSEATAAAARAVGTAGAPLGALQCSSAAGSWAGHQREQQQQQQQAAAGGAGVLTASRQQALQQQIDAGQQQAAALQQQLKNLQQQVDRLASDASASQDQQLTVLAGVQDSVQVLSDKLTQQVALLRRELKPAVQAQEHQQLSLADLTKLQRQVESMSTTTTGLTKELAGIKSKDLAALSSNVSELSLRVRKLAPSSGGISDTERAIIAAQADMRAQVVGLSARLSSHEAAELAAKGVASQQELQELSNLMRDKTSQEDMRDVVNRAVTLAIEAFRSGLEEQGGAAASRTRCLVCERTVSPPRCTTAPTPHLAESTAGLPFFDAFRPATALPAVSGCSASAGPGCSSTSNTAGGRPVSPKQGSAVGGGCPPLGPMGPGLNAAQLRQLSAQKGGRPGSAAAALAAAGEAGGPGGYYSSSCMSPVPCPDENGLIVSDLVSSNLRISPVVTAVTHGHNAASSSGSGGGSCGGGGEFSGGYGNSSSGDAFRGVGACSTSGNGSASGQVAPVRSHSSLQRQKMQQRPLSPGVMGMAAAAGALRPQTAAASAVKGSKPEALFGVRPSTAVGDALNTSSGLVKASGGKRTPVFV